MAGWFGTCLLRVTSMIGRWTLVEFLTLIESKAPLREVEDESWWHLRQNGRFDIRSFYDSLQDSPHVVFPWKSIWLTKAPRRVRFFVWTAAWNKILTYDNLPSGVTPS
jgi:hypothetical protein